MRKLSKLFRLLKKPVYLKGLLRGVAATVEHENALRHLSPNTIIDIGAHHGQFALLCRSMFPGARVHSFEPLMESASIYQRAHKGDEFVTLHPSAVGDITGIADLYVSKKTDSSSLLPIAKLQADTFPGTDLKETTKVRVAPLRELIDYETLEPPILLKIDVQGYELHTLTGCADLLPKVGAVYVEASCSEFYEGQAALGDVFEFLLRYEFRLSGLHNAVSSEQAGVLQADLLFLLPVADPNPS